MKCVINLFQIVDSSPCNFIHESFLYVLFHIKVLYIHTYIHTYNHSISIITALLFFAGDAVMNPRLAIRKKPLADVACEQVSLGTAPFTTAVICLGYFLCTTKNSDASKVPTFVYIDIRNSELRG
jgi:hypothetical protein